MHIIHKTLPTYEWDHNPNRHGTTESYLHSWKHDTLPPQFPCGRREGGNGLWIRNAVALRYLPSMMRQKV